MSKRMRVFVGGWLLFVGLVRISLLHRAPTRAAPHFHSQITDSLTIGLFLVLCGLGVVMLAKYLED